MIAISVEVIEGDSAISISVPNYNVWTKVTKYEWQWLVVNPRQ